MEPEGGTRARARVQLFSRCWGPMEQEGSLQSRGGSTWPAEGTGPRGADLVQGEGSAKGALGGLEFELDASQAEDRGWSPASLKTGSGGNHRICSSDVIRILFLKDHWLLCGRQTEAGERDTDRGRRRRGGKEGG